jgi:hypothetical protein
MVPLQTLLPQLVLDIRTPSTSSCKPSVSDETSPATPATNAERKDTGLGNVQKEEIDRVHVDGSNLALGEVDSQVPHAAVVVDTLLA